MPVLFIFSGLPGSGKTTLARHTGAVYLRIDTVEQALRDLCGINVEGEGYRLSNANRKICHGYDPTAMERRRLCR